MKQFKILYIEHEPDREITKQGIMKVKDASLETISNKPNMDFLYEKLIKEHYDLVITDTHFLEKDQTHDEVYMDGEFLLPEIIDTVRSVDNKRTRIAILTHFSGSLLKNNYNELDKVDYLWDKSSSSEDFISWQVKRVKEDSQRFFPGQKIFLLINELNKNQNFKSLKWHKSLDAMCKGILTQYRTHEQVFYAKNQLKTIASTYGIGDEIGTLLENIEETELYNIATKPSAWGHLKHVLYVYLLGYIILNSKIFNIDIFENKICDNNDSIETKINKINITWFLTSLIHDIGIFSERIDKLMLSTKGLAKIYPDFPFEFILKNGRDSIKQKLGTFYPQLISTIESEESSWYDSILKNEYYLLNHGILSGIALLIHFGDNPKFKNYAKVAARASSLHNIIQPLTADEKKEISYPYQDPPQLTWEKYPFDCLLILCDQLQIWDRSTGQEKLFSEMPLESVELSEIQIKEKSIYIVINYLPFRYLSPSSNDYELLQDKIEKFIDSKTIKSLKRIEDLNFTNKIEVEFIFDGNTKNPIRKWPPEML